MTRTDQHRPAHAPKACQWQRSSDASSCQYSPELHCSPELDEGYIPPTSSPPPPPPPPPPSPPVEDSSINSDASPSLGPPRSFTTPPSPSTPSGAATNFDAAMLARGEREACRASSWASCVSPWRSCAASRATCASHLNKQYTYLNMHATGEEGSASSSHAVLAQTCPSLVPPSPSQPCFLSLV